MITKGFPVMLVSHSMNGCVSISNLKEEIALECDGFLEICSTHLGRLDKKKKKKNTLPVCLKVLNEMTVHGLVSEAQRRRRRRECIVRRCSEHFSEYVH